MIWVLELIPIHKKATINGSSLIPGFYRSKTQVEFEFCFDHKFLKPINKSSGTFFVQIRVKYRDKLAKLLPIKGDMIKFVSPL
jgi:hypothetical protein